jgi:hypothetical protein
MSRTSRHKQHHEQQVRNWIVGILVEVFFWITQTLQVIISIVIIQSFWRPFHQRLVSSAFARILSSGEKIALLNLLVRASGSKSRCEVKEVTGVSSCLASYSASSWSQKEVFMSAVRAVHDGVAFVWITPFWDWIGCINRYYSTHGAENEKKKLNRI